MIFICYAELPLLIFRLPVFYKQRDNLFHPAWAWSLASFLLSVPYSIIESVVWSAIVYYSVGFAPEIWRFFRFVLVLFSVHQMTIGLFRTLASVARDMVATFALVSACLLIIFSSAMVKPWWAWAFWISPLTYAQRAISVNEFGAERWMKSSTFGNGTIGHNVLNNHSLTTDDRWYWLGVGVLLTYALFLNVIATLALAFLHRSANRTTFWFLFSAGDRKKKSSGTSMEEVVRRGTFLPFEPLVMTFHNVSYFVEMPKVYFSSLEFVEQVMRLVELDTLRLALVGLPGSSGLSREQRKRLTIAVELVANPSIIFMDEPTSGLDARAAAVVMRTMRNTVDTGRTVVCTIHQPSIDIFESFDELLLMKQGGKIIYGGQRGLYSRTLIDYFQVMLQKPELFQERFVPGWWIWLYYICPVAWTLQGIISSQLGDVETVIEGPGFRGSVKDYLKEYYGYGTNMVGPSVGVLVCFSILFFSAYAASLKFINFQRR
ncbi:unnamed protein product [Linum tenue]|uniref:ABC transporter domain-containing protein n=1 Tax=Linum tenue TaxID=586396 RepID=A0AAV0PC14_9ROSI|nr:unnamed protein product [Linum tenue]